MHLIITNIKPDKVKALTHILNDVLQNVSPESKIEIIKPLKGKHEQRKNNTKDRKMVKHKP